ncbi:MAG: hypothetical protein J0G34_14835 [Afipia sp.]|mgnify:CR=1 FL=1|nr:hypothetical protein [Afipia sp.]
MAGIYLVRIGVIGALAMMLNPATSSASQLNITTVPVRPQIYIAPSMHMGIGPRSSYDLDQSERCRQDHLVKRTKRERRCRFDR